MRAALAAGAQDCLPIDRLDGAYLRHAVVGAIERKQLEQRRLRYAREDELTGLANRALLEERFARAVARAERQDSLVGLVAIDLAHVVRLVDDQQTRLGDRLLCAAAERFGRLVRSTDTLARTRPRGFTWLVEGLHQVDEVGALAARLTALLEPCFPLDQLEVRLTASAGIALYPLHARRFGELHDIAEAAMSDVASISGDGYLIAPLPFHRITAAHHASAA
jgi:diguanylate cyclase (GGDEF)-like protein